MVIICKQGSRNCDNISNCVNYCIFFTYLLLYIFYIFTIIYFVYMLTIEYLVKDDVVFINVCPPT